MDCSCHVRDGVLELITMKEVVEDVKEESRLSVERYRGAEDVAFVDVRNERRTRK